MPFPERGQTHEKVNTKKGNMRYFKKINPKQALLGSKGQWITFPDFNNGFGGYATEDPTMIAEFTLAMRKNVGGIEEVNEEEFESLKKKEPLLNQPSGDSLRLSMLQFERGQSRGVAARGDERALTRVNREESLLMPKEAARPTGFRPNSVTR